MRGGDGGRRSPGHPEPGGGAHDSLHRRLHREGRAAGGLDRQAAGPHQPQEHRLRGEAAHRAQVRLARGRGGPSLHAVPAGRGRERRRAHPDRGQGLLPAGDLVLRAAEAQGGGGGLPRRGGRGSDHHRPRLLQRPPAPGHEGRGPRGRPQGLAHHQRADRGRPRLRAQEHRQERPVRGRLRPRGRHLRHHDPGARGRPVPGAGDGRGHLPRGRGLRPADHRLADRRVPARDLDRPHPGPHGPPAPEGGGGEGEVRAQHRAADRDRAALHLGGRDRARSTSTRCSPGRSTRS